jgi:hypothetical protein
MLLCGTMLQAVARRQTRSESGSAAVVIQEIKT